MEQNISMNSIRLWGKASFDELVKIYRHLVKKDDPAGSVRSFNLLKNGFFTFDAFQIEQQSDSNLKMTLSIAETDPAKEAIAHQMTGMLERMLELSGAKNIEYIFTQKGWENQPTSVVEMKWEK